MSDQGIQDALQTLIRAESDFEHDSVSQGNFLILTSGNPPYAVIMPGELIESNRFSWSHVQNVWMHTVEIFERFRDDDYKDFTSARQTIVKTVAQHPTLDGASGSDDGVWEVTNSRATATPTIYLKDSDSGNPVFVFSRVKVRTVEEITHDGYGEFA